MKSNTKSFPSILQAILLLLANLALTGFAVLILSFFRHPQDLNAPQLNALASLLGTSMLLFSIVRRQKMTYGDLLHPGESSVLATTAVLVPAVVLLVPLMVFIDIGLMEFMEALWPLSPWEQKLFALMNDYSFLNLLFVCLLAPALEEMLFRGILLRSFLQRYSRWLAIIISALFFGVAHLNIYQFALAFLLGLPLGWLYERSRSLIPCIALHAAMNTGAVIANMSAPPDTDVQVVNIPMWAWGLAAITAIMATRFLIRCLSAKSIQVSQ